MSLNVFKTFSTSKNSGARGAEEGVHYVIVKDGHGIEHKVLNLDNPEICPREGLVELEPMRRQWTVNRTRQKHYNNASFKCIRDKEMDVLVGIPIGIDSKTKNIIWQTINAGDGEIFDLSIPDQAMRWACIKRGPFFIDSPNYSSHSKTAYKAVDKERAAETYLMQRKTKRKALDIAESLAGTELNDYALRIGLNPKSMSHRALEVEVIKFAEAEPEKFMAIHNSDTRIELAVLNRAKLLGIVDQTYDAGINYNGITLGHNEIEALQYLKEHPATLASIDALSKKNETEGDKAMGITKKPMEADEANARIARLEKELADKEAALRQANEKALELQSNADLKEVDPELAETLAEAKRLGVKGAHLIGDKDGVRAIDRLKEKIAEKQAQAKN